MRLTLIACVLGLACGSALAQQVPTEEAGIPPGTLTAYTEHDANGDGIVTMAEFIALVPAGHETAARACDGNADGNLSQAEYDACAGYEAAPDVAARPR